MIWASVLHNQCLCHKENLKLPWVKNICDFWNMSYHICGLHFYIFKESVCVSTRGVVAHHNWHMPKLWNIIRIIRVVLLELEYAWSTCSLTINTISSPLQLWPAANGLANRSMSKSQDTWVLSLPWVRSRRKVKEGCRKSSSQAPPAGPMTGSSVNLWQADPTHPALGAGHPSFPGEGYFCLELKTVVKFN